MSSIRACSAPAILALLVSCGGEQEEPEAPKGELVFARRDLRYLVGETASGDMILVTDDGTVLALDHARVPTVVAGRLGRLRTDFEISVEGGAVFVWRKRGSSWDLEAWTRAQGLRMVAVDLNAPAHRYTRATPDGDRIIFATGGYFTNDQGTDLIVYGHRLAGALPAPVKLAQVPADQSTGWIEVTLAGDHTVVRRYRERALRRDLPKEPWPLSSEPWEAVWFDSDWGYRAALPHVEHLSLGDSALRVAAASADGVVTIAEPDGSSAIVVDEGCRFSDPFLLPGDAALVYSCRGFAYKFDVATRVRTALTTIAGSGAPGVSPLLCGESRCREWFGLGVGRVVGVATGATMSVPPGGSSLSPDGRFAVVPANEGAISLVPVGSTSPRVVLDAKARSFSWLEGARFTYALTPETNARSEDASMTVHWRDADAERRDEVVARDVITPMARPAERAFYALVRRPDQPNGLYRYPMPN